LEPHLYVISSWIIKRVYIILIWNTINRSSNLDNYFIFFKILTSISHLKALFNSFSVIIYFLFVVYTVNLPVVRPWSCRVIYYFDTPALGMRHQSFDRVIYPLWFYFWAWIIFLSWKIPTRITPHIEGKWKFQWEKMKKPWESRKGKRAQETQWLGGMPKSQEKVITKIKWVCPRKEMKKEKGRIKEKRQK